MALDVLIGGSNLDASDNLKVALTNDPIYTGSVRSFNENDPGSITGTPYLKSPETSLDYRQRVGMDTILFSDSFNAVAANTNNWSYTNATMTATPPGTGTMNFGIVQGTANAHGAAYRTYQYFPIIGTAPLSVEFSVGQFTADLVTNEVFAFGYGLYANAASLPTDGVYFQLTTAGLVGALVYNGGAIVQTGILATLASLSLSSLYKFTIVIGEREVEYWRDDVLLATQEIPVANGQPCIQSSLPVFMMKYCTGVVANTNTMRVSDVTVSLMDIATNKPWAHQAATSGMSGYVGQNGHTQGKTTLWANNTAPSASILVNTSAVFTGLGGIVAITPTLTANNDGILFSYLNPVPTINITGRNLVITGVRLQGVSSTVLTGGPVVYAYALAFGHVTVTLAATETAAAHAPRILPIGIETFAANAVQGVLGSQGLTLNLTTPVVIRPGEYVQIIARNIGTVTTAGAITVVASYDSYWE